jgi:hypothetical protein
MLSRKFPVTTIHPLLMKAGGADEGEGAAAGVESLIDICGAWQADELWLLLRSPKQVDDLLKVQAHRPRLEDSAPDRLSEK